MLKVVSIILFATLFAGVAAKADVSDTAAASFVGFSTGNEFTATPIEGTVVMTCDGFNGNTQAVYSCRDVVLDPQGSDTFVGPIDVRATQVELHAVHEDGSDRVKMASYNGKTGKSTVTFNLWMSSLFQKPLLMAGVNKISYSVYSPKAADTMQEFASGSFIVNVKRNTSRRCPTTQYTSTDVIDCNSQYSICQRYFEQYNSCR